MAETVDLTGGMIVEDQPQDPLAQTALLFKRMAEHLHTDRPDLDSRMIVHAMAAGLGMFLGHHTNMPSLARDGQDDVLASIFETLRHTYHGNAALVLCDRTEGSA